MQNFKNEYNVALLSNCGYRTPEILNVINKVKYKEGSNVAK